MYISNVNWADIDGMGGKYQLLKYNADGGKEEGSYEDLDLNIENNTIEFTFPDGYMH